ncbi:23S rRNA (guanosine(2251)-2'-O)-methyltransferase RlmB [Membranihabitans maritimus]|uniref:23S rRNA (guanosine(2251)-2'-O)-methyltransferase RlmB n=1 Tax=Membranihabitans maritimus TaxID=2904244 RepID=UPI001F00F13E|nr:23S rRNA (guanosine(2251)-2'-O)-methyltransferase RlmB [Membranihabitans maritimus]
MGKSPNIIVGRKPVLDAIGDFTPISSLWIDSTLKGPVEMELRKAAKAQNIPIKRVNRTILDRKYKVNHQGIIAYTSPIKFQELNDIIPAVYESGQVPFFLYLDRVQDVGNLGSIIRTAEALGVHALIIPSKKSAPINEQVVKISAGAVHNLPIVRIHSVHDTLELLTNNGIQILSSSLKAKKSIDFIDLTVPLCLVVGSEETGISNDIEKKSDDLFSIPQIGKTESLNAAIATGIITYEVQRQRRIESTSP